ncbi:hypothetical protein BMS3Bbin01_02585 [bacterium BMS3Bbin01]|nr:hypothetical protein BMS3Bbin01_02585 [bacterium BMS3Bbin01]
MSQQSDGGRSSAPSTPKTKPVSEPEPRVIAGEIRKGSGSLPKLGLPSDAPAPSAALVGPRPASGSASSSDTQQENRPEK